VGVSASGATLEITLVADVARLKRDMAQMQQVVGSATSGVKASFEAVSVSTAASATRMAAAAQVSARAAVGLAGGVTAAGAASGLARVQLLEMSHVATSLTGSLIAGQNPLRALAVELPRIAQAASFGGSGIKGLIGRLLEMVGVIQVTRDAELGAAAATSAAAAAAIRQVAERSAATLAARETQVALAKAELETAASADAEAAAQGRLVKALRAVEVAAGKAAIANQALATADAEAGAAAEASQAATVTGIGRMGLVLGATAAAALLLAAAFESVKKDAASNGELDKFASGLRLTDEQVRKAGGSVKYLSDRTREVTGITVTWGNIASATYQVLLERAGTTSKGISDGFTSAFKWIGDFGKFTISLLLAGFAGLIELVMSVGKNLGRLATGNFDQLTNPLKDVQKQFYKTFNDVEAGFDAIGKRAADLRKAQLQIESDANKPPKPPKAKKQSDHGLAEALAELDAQIKGQNALAAAYQVSDAQAIKAEAMQKAEEQAIRHKGDVALFYEKELSLAVAQRAAEGGRLIADIHAEAAARTVVNDLVEQGVIPVQRMSQALDEQTKKRQLMAALEAAEDKGMIERAGELRAEIANLVFSQGVLNDELAKEAALQQVATNKDKIDELKIEIELVGASNKVRAERLAILQAEQYIRDKGITDPQDKSDVTKSYVDAAIAANDLATAQDLYNKALSYTADLLEVMNQRAQTVEDVRAARRVGLPRRRRDGRGHRIARLQGRQGAGFTAAALRPARRVQAAQGTGTVLGDANANREHRAQPRPHRREHEQDAGIRQPAAALAARASRKHRRARCAGRERASARRRVRHDGQAGTTTSGGILGLFGSTTTKSLYDQGLQFNPTSLADAIANGISGATYQIIEKVKKSSGFLGIGGGTKTSYSTTTGALDPDLQRQVGLILGRFATALSGGQGARLRRAGRARHVPGRNRQDQLQGHERRRDQKALEACSRRSPIRWRASPSRARAVPEGRRGPVRNAAAARQGLHDHRRRAEVDRQDVRLRRRGLDRRAREPDRAVRLARGLRRPDGVLPAEFPHRRAAIAPIEAQVKATLASLGLSSVDTIAKFNQVVQGIDLTTDAGQQLYASLMALAPAFYQVEQYQAQQAAAAAALAKQKAQLEITAAAGAGQGDRSAGQAAGKMELAALDPSLRALQQQIYTAQDIAAAKDKLAQAYQRERDRARSDDQQVRRSVEEPAGLSRHAVRRRRAATYNQALAKLISTGSLASAGDATALGDLQGVGKSFLDVAKDRSGLAQQYQRDVALVARYVDQGISRGGRSGVDGAEAARHDDGPGRQAHRHQRQRAFGQGRDPCAEQAAQAASRPPTDWTAAEAGTGLRRRLAAGQDHSAGASTSALARYVAAITATGDHTNQQTAAQNWDRGGSLRSRPTSDTPLATTHAT
jgi:hypothetical protein